jgi:predicted helicase
MARIHYARVDEFWRREEKYAYLDQQQHGGNVAWQEIQPDAKHNWLTEGVQSDFENLVPLSKDNGASQAIFDVISNGVQTNRDAWVYNFGRGALAKNIERLIDTYNEQVRRWHKQKRRPEDIDAFVLSDDKEIKWSSRLKERLAANVTAAFEPENVRGALYRPFTFQYLYFDSILVHRRGRFPQILPAPTTKENKVIWLKTGSDWPVFALATNRIPDQLPQGDSQCFPF